MEIEERAKIMGWVPKEDFKGDPERWTSAEDYVERADTIMPIMKATMNKYEKTIESQSGELKANKKDIAELRETMRKLATTNQKVSEHAYNKALETIRKEQEQAITDGDGEKFHRLEKDKDDLMNNKPEPVEVQSPPPDTATNPEYQAWVADNPWYEDNPKLRKYADSVVYGKAQMTGKTGRELMDLLVEEVKEMFPEEFENPNRQDAAAVSSGTTQGKTQPEKTGYSSLPADAKQACDDFVAQGLGTKKDYIDMFNEA